MRVFIALLAGMLAFSVYSQEITDVEINFCSDRQDVDFAQDQIMRSENRLSFTNQGGLANGGVCWWHSRLTRKMTYLAIFRPDLEKPTSKEAKSLIRSIRLGNVTVIPGYSNLREFSRDFRKEIQNRLEKWQVGDGFMRMQWTVGLWGASKTNAEKLQRRMENLYEEVEVKKNLTYQMLQLKGIVAHAWLVTKMKKLSDGYELTVIDSNYAAPKHFRYTFGDTHLNYSYFGRFVPITGKKNELSRMKKAVSKYCQKILK